MKTKSINFKLLSLMISAFLLTAVSVILLTDRQINKIIDKSQYETYSEKADSVIGFISRNYQSLQDTLMVEAYEEQFKSKAIETMRSDYYKDMGPHKYIYPFIIDGAGRVVMHPVLAAGTDMSKIDFIKQIIAEKNGCLNYYYDGQQKWMTFKHFEGWNWFVGYTMPLDVKYADSHQIRNTLILIVSAIATIIVSVLTIILTKFTKPITELTKVSAEMAAGKLDSRINVNRSDEIGVLAKSFEKMREAVKDQITLIRQKNIEQTQTLEQLGNEVAERKKAELELEKINKDLEKIVDDRTSNLAETIEKLNSEVAERKRAEETLRRSETKYHMLYDTTSDAIMMLGDGKFFDCNKSTLEIYGCASVEEFCSKHPADFSPAKQPGGEDSLTLANKQIAIAIEKGSSHFEWVHKRADNGKEFLADVLINAMELDGKKVVHTVVRDITEHKQQDIIQKRRINYQNTLLKMAKLENVEMDDTLKAIIKEDADTLGVERVSVWFFNEDKSAINCENLYTLSKKTYEKGFTLQAADYPVYFRSMGDTRIVAANDAWTNPHTREFTEAYFKPAGITSMLDVFIRVCGTVVGVVCHEHVGPMRQWTLEEQEFAASVADLVSIKLEAFGHKQAEENMKELNNELEQAVKKLEETNQELKNFVYIASHDLREPLRKISAFGSMVQKSLSGKIDGDDAENLNFMIDGANRMTKMIEGLLAYSRVSSKANSAETVNLNDIVDQLRQLELSVLLEEKHTTIDIPQPLPEVDADPVQIRQLMQNLIANGMKYQAKGNTPQITITSRPAADGMARINITDNGIGIKPEFQQAIFIMFKRLHSKNEYEGTGIGLAVCKKIVERNGGKIGVESEPGKGSTFWFTVPLAKTVMDNTELVQNSQKELL